MKKIIETSHIKSARVVVEIGPGTGVFTREILKHLPENAVFLCIESNKTFCQQISPLFEKRENAHLIFASASETKTILKKFGLKKIDTVISSLPFNILPKSFCKNILSLFSELLSQDGEFLCLLYSKLRRPLFDEFFPHQTWKRVYLNFPPAYVLRATFLALK